MVRIILKGVFGYLLTLYGCEFQSGWWLALLLGGVLILGAVSTFLQGLAAAVQAMRREDGPQEWYREH